MVIGFGPLPATHEDLDGFERRPPAFEDCGHLGSDRQLDAVSRTERQGCPRRSHALGDHVQTCEDIR